MAWCYGKTQKFSWRAIELPQVLAWSEKGRDHVNLCHFHISETNEDMRIISLGEFYPLSAYTEVAKRSLSLPYRERIALIGEV